MKLTFITIVFTILSFLSHGQDSLKTDKIKEYHLTLAGLSPISMSIHMKKQTGTHSFFKIGFVNLAGNYNRNNPRDTTRNKSLAYGYSAGMQIGIEFRKKLSDKWTFFHGPNIKFGYAGQHTIFENQTLPFNKRKNKEENFNAGIPYVFGLLYTINIHLLLSAEINPGIFVGKTTITDDQHPERKEEIVASNFLFDNRYALLTIVYRK